MYFTENSGLQASHPRNNYESTRVLVFALAGAGAALVIIIVLVFGKWFYHKKYTMLKLQAFNHQLFREGRLSVYDPNVALDDQADLLPYDEKWEFPKENLKLGRTLGQGAFGRVVKAEAFGLNDYEVSTTVAVKMLKERADLHQQKALIAELKILIHLGHHVNIVNLMGAVTRNIPQGELLVMVEYCRYGNICEYLLRYRDNFISDIESCSGELSYIPKLSQLDSCRFAGLRSDSVASSQGSASTGIALDNPSYRERIQSNVSTDIKPSLTSMSSMQRSMSSASESGSVFRNYHRVDSCQHAIYTSDLICYAFQCACGMNYLASKKLIHRDLAARNVLLADDKVVKICDFGLAKDCYKFENYVKKGDGPLPIKWMAIESIRDHVFTTKSDVWSFAILMWELFALGSNPYPGIEVDEDFYKRLNSGYRMEKPDYCPDVIYRIMQDCWHSSPDERPDFNQISNILGGFLEAGVKQHYKDLNTPYMEMNSQKQDPDYCNVAAAHYKNVTYVNSNISAGALYDTVPTVNRPVLDISVPSEAMEVVNMIQLETINEERSPEVNVRTNSSDYLQMGENRSESGL